MYFPELPNDNHDMVELKDVSQLEPYAYVDSEWATDSKTRKPVTGLAVIPAGTPIAYKSKSKRTIAHSTIEAKFAATTDYAKMVLYLRSILKEVGYKPRHATIIYEDNEAAIEMDNAQRPTRRTNHMKLKQFALLQWCEIDQIILTAILMSYNATDGLTKTLTKVLFGCHRATLLRH